MKYLILLALIYVQCSQDCKHCETEIGIYSLSGTKLSSGHVGSQECGDEAEGYTNKQTNVNWNGQKAIKIETRICD